MKKLLLLTATIFIFTYSASSEVPTVELYGHSGCRACVEIKDILRSKGIRYKSFDVRKKEIEQIYVKRFGRGKIPVSVIGSTVIRGDFPERVLRAVRDYQKEGISKTLQSEETFDFNAKEDPKKKEVDKNKETSLKTVSGSEEHKDDLLDDPHEEQEISEAKPTKTTVDWHKVLLNDKDVNQTFEEPSEDTKGKYYFFYGALKDEIKGYYHKDSVEYFTLSKERLQVAAVPLSYEGSGGYVAYLIYSLFDNPPLIIGTISAVKRPILLEENGNLIIKKPIYLSDDPNCCPTGGEATRIYSIKNRKLIATSTWEDENGNPVTVLSAEEEINAYVTNVMQSVKVTPKKKESKRTPPSNEPVPTSNHIGLYLFWGLLLAFLVIYLPFYLWKLFSNDKRKVLDVMRASAVDTLNNSSEDDIFSGLESRTKDESISLFQDLKRRKDTRYFMSIQYKGGFHDIKEKRFFSPVRMNIFVTPYGIHFFEESTSKEKLIEWDKLLDVLSEKSKGENLDENSLIFTFKNHQDYDLKQEIIFRTRKNDRIRSVVMKMWENVKEEGTAKLSDVETLEKEIEIALSLSPLAALEKLCSLYEKGLLSEEEFKEQKKRISEKGK